MQIRNKLSLYFTITSSLLMLLIMAFIYLLFANQTKLDFYHELHERAEVAAQMYLEADEISETALQKIKERFVVSLPNEEINMYDSADNAAFIKEGNRQWPLQIIDQVRRGKYLTYQQDGKQVVGIDYDDNQGNYVILAAATDLHGQERLRNLMGIMAALFSLQLAIQLILGRWFAQRALLPIQQVNAQVTKISATDLHMRVDTENEKDEIGILAGNFNNLLQRLEKSFDLQRMFVANASHELRTPVTNIIGEIEVALSKERSAGDYKDALQSVLAEADRLSDIIRNLLLLASAENNKEAELTEPVRLDELLWEIKDAFYKQGADLQVQLTNMPADENKLYVKANKTLLTVAINNIIQNGIKFSNGKPVLCTLRFDRDRITIEVTDRGIGIEAAALQNIFEPFYRSATADNYSGHGIGLYIAKKIVELFNGHIEVASAPGKGSTFNIAFIQKH